jgi:DNA processing protein
MSIDSHEFSVWIQAVLEIDKVARKSAWKIFRELPNTVVDRKSFAEYASAKSETESRMPGFGADQVMERFSEAEELLDKTRSTNNGSVLNFRDFPTKLREMDDPPLLVHCLGDSSLISSPSVAVIGTREPTGFGSDAAIEFGKQLAENGQVVVSGLALGCDTGGHEGCLEADGKTIAVLAHGLDTMFPKENRDLAISILSRGGLLLSEYKFGVGARGHQFVERDRIQAALSDAVIVVETGVEGGTLHTVGFAEKNDVPVFALDHPPEFHEEKQVAGNLMLIEETRANPLQANKKSLRSMLDSLGALIPTRQEEDCEASERKSKNNFETPLFPVKGAIFDLDQTLVDSSLADEKRKKGLWEEVYELIPHFTVYPGIVEALTAIREKGINVCIVTSSPSIYCGKVLGHFGIPHDFKVCYHDTERRKPDPQPFEKALSQMGLNAEDVFAFGDKAEDAIGASGAGIDNAACVWGIDEYKKNSALEKHAQYVLSDPSGILRCLGL